MQLDTAEVQTAVAEYLRKRGMVIDDANQVQLAIVDSTGAHMKIAGCSPVVLAYNIKLPEAPYR